MNELEQRLFALVNTQRLFRRVRPLVEVNELSQAARRHATPTLASVTRYEVRMTQLFARFER